MVLFYLTRPTGNNFLLKGGLIRGIVSKIEEIYDKIYDLLSLIYIPGPTYLICFIMGIWLDIQANLIVFFKKRSSGLVKACQTGHVKR